MRREQDFDSRIEAALDQECDGISASEELKNRIDAAVCGQQAAQERRTAMKHISIKKICVAAAAACLLVSGISVFAGKVDFFVSVGRMGSDYTDYRDMEKVQEELGYGVDSVERFANGYVFEGANIDFVVAYSEESGQMGRLPSMNASYRKDGKQIDLIVSETAGESTDAVRFGEPDATRMCGDIMLRYNECTLKMVPEGYELTEEDMRNEQRDDFHIVFLSLTESKNTEEEDRTETDGVKKDDYYIAANRSDVVTLKQTGESWMKWRDSGEPFVQQTQIVRWEKDGKYYELSGADLELSADELFAMAEEILGAGQP